MGFAFLPPVFGNEVNSAVSSDAGVSVDFLISDGVLRRRELVIADGI